MIPSRRNILFAIIGIFVAFSAKANLDVPIVPELPMDRVTQPSPAAATISRYTDLPVNYATGTANIHIPLMEWSVGGFPMSVSLNYNTGGIKKSLKPGQVGLGWSLDATGVIIRQVVGIPDEKRIDKMPGEKDMDVGYLEDVYRNYEDEGLDRYTFSYMGKSGTFYISDPYKKPVYLMASEDMKIERINLDNGVSDFKITEPDGTEYYFTKRERQTRKQVSTVYGYSQLCNREFQFIGAWYLEKIVTPRSREEITYEYESLNYYTETSFTRFAPTINVKANKANASRTSSEGSNVIIIHPTQPILKSITSRTATVDFEWKTQESDPIASRAILKEVAMKNIYGQCVKKSRLIMSYFEDGRDKLFGVEMYAEDKMIDFRYFDYKTMGSSNGSDFWGYPKRINSYNKSVLHFNGKWNHAFDADKDCVDGGMLYKITEMSGAETELSYEPSRHRVYYDYEQEDSIKGDSIKYAPPYTGIDGEFVIDPENPNPGNPTVPGYDDTPKQAPEYIGKWWWATVSIGVRLKQITVRDPSTGRERWRKFAYWESMPNVDFGDLLPCDFISVSGTIQTGSAYAAGIAGDFVEMVDPDYPTGGIGSFVGGTSGTSDPYKVSRTMALHNNCRRPGFRPEDATVLYGHVVESISGTGMDRAEVVEYRYDLSNAIHTSQWAGCGYISQKTRNNVPLYVAVPDNGIYCDGNLGYNNLFSEWPIIQGYFKEQIGAEPQLVGKTRRDAKTNRILESVRYTYTCAQNKSLATSIFVEPLIYSRIRNNGAANCSFEETTDFNWFYVNTAFSSWHCDSVIKTEYDLNGTSRTIETTLDYFDLIAERGEISKENYNFQKIFGDTASIENIETLFSPMLRSIKTTFGSTRIEKHFLYSVNIPSPHSPGNLQRPPGMPLATCWISGNDTIRTHSAYGAFTLDQNRKVILPMAETLLNKHKTISTLRCHSYSQWGQPTAVTRDCSPTVYYTWGEDGDCLLSKKVGDNGPTTGYAHQPLVGCTRIVYPSKRIRNFIYRNGRLIRETNTAGATTTEWDYGLYYDEGWQNRVTTKSYSDNVTFNARHDIYDCLGDEFFSVAEGAGGGKEDIVTSAVWRDALGRPTHTYMPFPDGDALEWGIYYPSAASDFYNDTIPYMATQYIGPNGTEIRTTAPGEDMRGHSSISRRLFNTPLTPELNCFISSPGDFGVVMDPAPGGIYTVDVNIDADGRKTYQFTDFQGRKVLDRRVSTAGFLDTYYCYDNLGQLLYVSPPEMSKKIVRRRNIEFCFLKSDFDRLGYVYTYNDSMLLKSKKLPGCEPVTYRYDGARNLVFSQDGIQRSKNEMAFNLYTPVGGLAVTGICKATACNGLEQMMAVTTFSETGAEATVDSCGYSWQLPLEGVRLLKVNYYDNYKFTKLAKFDTLRSRAGSDTSRWPGRKGLALGHLTAVLGATGKYDTGVVKYDNEERPVNAITLGHDGLMEEYSTVYSLDGLPLSSSHLVSGEDKQSHENYEFSYDHARRLSQIRLSVDGDGSYILAKNRYDAIGRLVATQTGDLEKESFFNVRGNLTASRSAYFAEILDYTRNAMEPSFSGNVARYSWGNTDMPQQSYDYIYDEADRLINAVHFKKNEELYSANYTYDMNTNITSLVRLGKDSPNTYGVVDELHFTLNGNQTVKVTDMADEVLLENSMDFHDGADADDEMAYDANGRLVRDLNRNITEIEYNDIGMPFRIWIGDILRHQFTYNADGTLLSRTEYNGGTKVWIKPTFPQFPFRSASFGFNTPGLNDQIYTESQNRTLRYAGSQIWENDSCSRIETDFGYIEGDSLCIYCRDFQGNIRAVVSSGTGHVLQTTHYYPYGMPWAEGIGRNANQRKYSGKELYTANGYNTYNFEARHYGGGGLPIFSTPDPLAEIHHDISPYTYCAGNPISYIDPTGLDWVKRRRHGVDEYYFDRDITSPDQIPEGSGLTYIGDGTTIDLCGYKFTFYNSGTGSVALDGQLSSPKKTYFDSEHNVFKIFATSDESLNPATLDKNFFGTSYIGPNNPMTYGKPNPTKQEEIPQYTYTEPARGDSENMAKIHDKVYDLAKANGALDAFMNVSLTVLGADLAFAMRNWESAIKNADNPTELRRSICCALGFTFLLGNKCMNYTLYQAYTSIKYSIDNISSSDK